jgi:hypothetical protein
MLDAVSSQSFRALEQYGRPRGPFEKDREHTYNAAVTVKTGPKIDQRHQEAPPTTASGSPATSGRAQSSRPWTNMKMTTRTMTTRRMQHE